MLKVKCLMFNKKAILLAESAFIYLFKTYKTTRIGISLPNNSHKAMAIFIAYLILSPYH